MNSYLNQTSGIIQEFPPDITNIPLFQGSSGLNTVSPAVFRLISLYAASISKYVVLSWNGSNIVGKQISYTDQSTDSLWRLVQIRWDIPGGAPSANFYVQHVSTGLYLAVENGNPTCKKLDTSESFSWGTNWGDRGIFFASVNQGYFCSGSNNSIIPNPSNILPYNTSIQTCSGFDATWPIGGKPFLRLGALESNGNYQVTMSGVLNDINQYLMTRKNDMENDWYMLYQYGDKKTCQIPVTHTMSIGRMLNWNPSDDYMAPFNVSRIPLQPRFVDTKTQTNPSNPQLPRVMAAIDSVAVDVYLQTRSNSNTYNFSFWQYTDYIICTGNDQGWAPVELKNLNIPSFIGSSIASGTTTKNLYDMIDGERPGQGGRIFIPPKNVVDNGHKNGCKVLGAIFFQETYYGGRWEWWEQFLADPVLTAHKLADICSYYGFDGFFINYESNTYYNSPCSGLCTKQGPYRYIGNSGQCQKAGANCQSDPLGNPVGPANETAPFAPTSTDPDYGDYWCHYDPHGQGGSWNPGCNAAPCSRCIQIAVENGPARQLASRTNLIAMMTEFQKYKKENNLTCEISMYECMAPDGSVDYYGGIQQENLDLWVDKNGNKVADTFFTMVPGGGVVPQGQTWTYIQTSEASKGCTDHDIQNHFGWPPNTGPQQVSGQCLQENFQCNPQVTSGDCLCTNSSCKQSIAAANIPPGRSYDFYATINMSGFAQNLVPASPDNGGIAWDTALYCGSQNCVWNSSNASTNPLTSLGLWSAKVYDITLTYEQNDKLNRSMWVSLNGMCANNDNTEPPSSGQLWKGISKYVSERSTFQTIPFCTNFCVGQGDEYYIEGNASGFGSWSDQLMDPAPTWRWWPIQRDATGVKLSFDFSCAFEGGNSLNVSGMSACTNTDYFLYKTNFSLGTSLVLEINYLCDNILRSDSGDSRVQIGYTLESTHPTINYLSILPYSTKWNSVKFNIPQGSDKIITLCVKGLGSNLPYSTFLGRLRLFPQNATPLNVSSVNVSVDASMQQTSSKLYNLNLKWSPTDGVDYYYVTYKGKYIGRVSGTGVKASSHTNNIPILYNVQNVNSTEGFNVIAVGLDGSKNNLNSLSPSPDSKKSKIILLVISIIFIGICIISSIMLYRRMGLTKLLIIPLLVFIICVVLIIIATSSSLSDSSSSSVSNFPIGTPSNIIYKTDSPTLSQAKVDVQTIAWSQYNQLLKYNKSLAILFYNTVVTPLYYWTYSEDSGLTYITTGNWGKDPPKPFSMTTDMGGMWLRDACCQAHAYIKYSKNSKALSKLIEGTISQCVIFLLLDSYANAFNPTSEFTSDSDPQGYQDGEGGYVTSKNYEPDSICFVIWLAFEYYLTTGSKTFFNDKFLIMLDKVITQFRKEQRRSQYQITITNPHTQIVNNPPITTQDVYRFSELPNGGIGSYVAPLNNGVGLTWSGYRPSDDIAVFGYNIPANMFAVTMMDNIVKYLPTIYSPSTITQNIIMNAGTLRDSLDIALSKWALFKHPIFGTIYAYETDCLGEDGFNGDGNTKSFTLNGVIAEDCNKYTGKDIYGNNTDCYPYYPYNDPSVNTLRQDCGCDHFGCNDLKTNIPGNSLENILVGTRMLEVTINGVAAQFGSYSIDGRSINFVNAPENGSYILVRGNFNIMDDANLPSLLSVPYFKYLGRAWDETIYQNTRKFALSIYNRWYSEGPTLKGIGSGHTAFTTQAGPNMVWPMSLIAQSITSNDTTNSESTDMLSMVLYSANINIANTLGPTPSSIAPEQSVNYIHESVWCKNPNYYSRGSFQWPNAYFNEWIQGLMLANKTSIFSNATPIGKNSC